MNNMHDNQNNFDEEELRQAELLNEYIDDLNSERSSQVFEKLGAGDRELLHILKTARDIKVQNKNIVPSENFTEQLKRRLLNENGSEETSFRYSESNPSALGWWSGVLKRTTYVLSATVVILIAVFVVQSTRTITEKNSIALKNTPPENVHDTTTAENTNKKPTTETSDEKANVNTEDANQENTSAEEEEINNDIVAKKNPDTGKNDADNISNTNAVGGGEEEFMITSDTTLALAKKYEDMTSDLTQASNNVNNADAAYRQIQDEATYNQAQTDINEVVF